MNRKDIYNYARPKPPVRRNFDVAKNVLEKALRKYGLEKKINRYKFVTMWPKIMGAAIAERTRPEFIRQETLHIRVADPAWAQELSFQKPVIIRRLQRFMQNEVKITDLRFFVGEL